MKDLQLVDYYKILHPDRRIYTWRKKKSSEAKSLGLHFNIRKFNKYGRKVLY